MLNVSFYQGQQPPQFIYQPGNWAPPQSAQANQSLQNQLQINTQPPQQQQANAQRGAPGEHAHQQVLFFDPFSPYADLARYI